ncbi:hypothetical protein L207DRAFT_630737 [Hyaloscypha variabilis F]|uniref:Uncharacterized protein n=1 Tax=Hyaloscypha variabilis (strain UAMH 11265 / GT02V1 / F) TaxID=1149755 RepID=A0A2J6S0U5_HYAVF|nr:hypothetical protein L207DRAFT_630737 [Hyaloscypha variabilis F]
MGDSSFFTISSEGDDLQPELSCSSPNGSASSLPPESNSAPSVSVESATSHPPLRHGLRAVTWEDSNGLTF